MSMAARTDGSIAKCVVSSKTASWAAFRGATARFMSRSSRARMSARTAASSTVSPRPRSSRMRRRARSCGRGGHVDFHFGVGSDHSSDVAAVDHRARSRSSESALQHDQRRPDLRDGGDDGGGLGDLVGFQVVLREAGRVIGLCGGNRVRGVAEPALNHHRQAHTAIQEAAVEMPEAVMRGEPPGDGALAGGGRTVDGDDHVRVRIDSAAFRISGKTASSNSITPPLLTPTNCGLAPELSYSHALSQFCKNHGS